MSKVLRLSEKWFRRGLWLVALVFAGFLIGLGGTIVGDLPKVETPLHIDDFLDHARAVELREKLKNLQQAKRDTQAALDQAQLQHSKKSEEHTSKHPSLMRISYADFYL